MFLINIQGQLKLIRFNFVQNSFSHINNFSTLVVKEFNFLNDFEKAFYF